MHTAFVTGSSGLLANNLVRLLARRGVRVRALAGSQEKPARQFAGVPVEIVEGDMPDVARFVASEHDARRGTQAPRGALSR